MIKQNKKERNPIDKNHWRRQHQQILRVDFGTIGREVGLPHRLRDKQHHRGKKQKKPHPAQSGPAKGDEQTDQEKGRDPVAAKARQIIAAQGAGIEQEFVKVLGMDIPHVTIPVRPGRDIARLIEVAAFQIKLRKSGYNAAEELNKRLLAQMASNAAPPSLSP